MKKLSIVVPCYNEQESVPLFYPAVQKVLDKLPVEPEYWFVDDGSKDKTLQEIKTLAAQDSKVHFISFSRNFGKEAAIYAGLQAATGDYVVLMDVDLQDPPSFCHKCILCWSLASMMQLVAGESIAKERVSLNHF